MRKDEDLMILIVYFYGGCVGYYNTNYKMIKWCFETYAKWAKAEDKNSVDGVITLHDELNAKVHFFRLDLVVGFNSMPFDKEAEELRKLQIKEQISAMRKIANAMDDHSSGDEWKKK